jgi:hypothetical protein
VWRPLANGAQEPSVADLSANSVVEARDDLLIREIDGQVIAWSPISPEPRALDPLSAVLLQLLDGRTSVGELVADMCDVLQIDEHGASGLLHHHLSLLDMGGLLASSIPTIHSITEDDVFPAAWDP